ncbi:MAG: GNAT family N-acetyltransferase [Solirubrobacteraceae bacterium]|jgi:GNAT superfamily N-acetyltransferase
MSGVAEIRFAESHERASLSDLHRRSSFVWAQDRAVLERHPDALGVAAEAIDERRVRVALGARGELLGFATVATAQDVCILDDLFVEPEVMRRGIGRLLVEDAAARARASGCVAMTVVSAARNFPFYEAVGFVPGEASPTRFGPAFLMRRTL